MFKETGIYGSFNSYDMLKLLALLAMILDHAGMYFWPDALWLRAIGRMAFPLFLFLVGYSGKWDVKPELLVLAALVLVCSVMTHHRVFPINILLTIALTRFVMSYITRCTLTSARLWGIYTVCIVWFPLFLWCEYSTSAVLFALCGYMCRQRPGTQETRFLLCATFIAHFIIEYYSFDFGTGDSVLMLAVTVLCAFLLMRFHVVPVMYMSARWLRWMARNTLPIYAFHIMAFMVVERILYPARLAGSHWF